MVVRLCVLSISAVATFAFAAPPAAATHLQDPPPIVLASKAGKQRAAQESFCVTAPPDPGEERVVRRCIDTVDKPPRRLSVVRPREVVTISFVGTEEIRDGVARVRILGRKRFFHAFPLTEPSTRWRVRLRPGAYEIEVFARFRAADGRTGDTLGSLGLLVDRNRKLAIVPLSAARPTPELTG